MESVRVIGGGLAGCEAAWQLADRGVPVTLVEMRPDQPTGAHRTDKLAEIVCTNSFKSTRMDTASGLLKAERRGRHVYYSALDAHVRDMLREMTAHVGEPEPAEGA